MKLTGHTSKIRCIKKDNPHFMIYDGLITSPRAGFEINKKCPREYQQVIASCIDRGWLSPVAHVHEKELLFIGLTK